MKKRTAKVREAAGQYVAKARSQRTNRLTRRKEPVAQRALPAKRRRALAIAVDLMVDLYGPALKELEKH